MADAIPDLNPEMSRLREELDKRGIGYEVDDSFDVFESGLLIHSEKTIFNGYSVIYVWLRDADNVKRFDSLGGRFNYLEVRRPDGSCSAVTVEEVLEMAC